MKQNVSRWFALAVVAAFAGVSVVTALNYALSDTAVLKARAQIGKWQKSTPSQLSAWEVGGVRNAVRNGQRHRPNDPNLYEYNGFLYGLQAMAAADLPELQYGMLDEAAANYRLAIQNRPMAPYAWSNLALSLHRREGDQMEMWQAVDRAMKYGAREGGVRLQLATVILERWEQAGEARQAWMRQIANEAEGALARRLRALIVASGQESLILAN